MTSLGRTERTPEHTSLSSIIADVTGNERTLTVYDADDEAAVAAVEDHFAVQNVKYS